MDRRLHKLVIIASTKFSGGAEIYVGNLGSALDAMGVDVHLGGRIDPWPRNLANDPLKLGPKWGLRSLFVGLFRAPFEISRVRKFLDVHQGATFNFHFKREQILFSKLAANRGRVVWTEHGTFPTGLFGRIVAPWYKRASRYPDEIVCVSDFVTRSIKDHVDETRRLVVINSAVDAVEFNPLRPHQRGPGRVALVVGRLEKTKRPQLAISAALAAGCSVLVAGTGRLEDALTREFGENSAVTFLGHVTDVAELYRSANVHIFCSNGVGEGFPTVLLEAAASGVPTIAVENCGFADEIINAGGAIAVPDVASISASVRLVLCENERRSKQAREWAITRSTSDWARAYCHSFFGERV